MRTDRVRGIAGVEIQAERPDVLAGRWSDIVEIPVSRGPAGEAALELENAIVRFVPITDGRPEGLGGVDLRAVDAARAVRAATDRGLPVDGQTVTICGTRFRLD